MLPWKPAGTTPTLGQVGDPRSTLGMWGDSEHLEQKGDPIARVGVPKYTGLRYQRRALWERVEKAVFDYPPSDDLISGDWRCIDEQ